MSTINKNAFHAALTNLENMAKAQGATQLHHTSSDSNPGSHAGTNTNDYQDEHTDGIDDNGTDYDGVKEALGQKVEKSQALTQAEVAIIKGQDPRPFIAEKVSKGESLTAAESWVVKGGYDKMKKMGMGSDLEMANKGADKPTSAGTPGEAKDSNSVPDSHAGESEQDEIEHDAKKSLGGAVAQSQTLRKGLELSAFLTEFTRAMGEALQGTEARTAQRVSKSVSAAITPIVERVAKLEQDVAKSFANQEEFNKGLGQTVVGIGQQIVGRSEVEAANAHAPVGAPKSQLRAAPQGVQAVEKSFGPGGLPNGSQALAKSQAIDAMSELVQKGQLDSLEVCKFEMTGEISPQVQQLVMAHISGQGAN